MRRRRKRNTDEINKAPLQRVVNSSNFGTKRRGQRGNSGERLARSYLRQRGYSVRSTAHERQTHADLEITRNNKSRQVEVKEVHETVRGERGRVQIERENIRNNKLYVFIVHRDNGSVEIHERMGTSVRRMIKNERSPSKIELNQLQSKRPEVVLTRKRRKT